MLMTVASGVHLRQEEVLPLEPEPTLVEEAPAKDNELFKSVRDCLQKILDHYNGAEVTDEEIEEAIHEVE